MLAPIHFHANSVAVAQLSFGVALFITVYIKLISKMYVEIRDLYSYIRAIIDTITDLELYIIDNM